MVHKSDGKGEVTTDLPAAACARDYLFALELKMGQHEHARFILTALMLEMHEDGH